jgi:hypothetical protein
VPVTSPVSHRRYRGTGTHFQVEPKPSLKLWVLLVGEYRDRRPQGRPVTRVAAGRRRALIMIMMMMMILVLVPGPPSLRLRLAGPHSGVSVFVRD